MTSGRGIKRIVVGAVLTAAFVCIALLAVRAWSLHVYAQERRAVREALHQLQRERRPGDVNAEAWKVSTSWIITAYENVCFSEHHVRIDELRRFRVDVEKRLTGVVDLTMIDWLWQRLAETGAHGQLYRTKFEPQYREHVNTALAKQ